MHYITQTVLGVLSLLCLIGYTQSDEVSLTIDPHYLQFNRDNTTEATAMCVLRNSSGTKIPLAGCQFIIQDLNHIWEFAKGPASPQSTSGKWPGRYHGKGLQHGDCGITITGFSNNDHFILGCRVQAAAVTSPWIYEKMLIYASFYEPQQFHLQPQATLATAGSNVSLDGDAEHELKWCRFWVPTSNSPIQLDFMNGLASGDPSVVRYHGSGFQNKQCGVTMFDVQPERSGFLKGWAYTAAPLRVSMDFVQLIVITAPEAPLLTVNTTGLLAPGEVLHATCVVKNSRPVANLTWILGDVVIREDNINEAPLDSKWRWGHDLQTIEQHLEHVVTLSDNGKQLKCKASHMALLSGFQDSMSYDIQVFRDLCLNNPCGANSNCRVHGDFAACSCQKHFVGSPPSCRPECLINTDCSPLRVCFDSRCVDPCISRSCGDGAQCHVAQHVAECKCLDGLIGDPLTRCEKDASDPCTPNPCRGPHTKCQAEGQVAVCSCQDPYIGSPPSCRPECVVNTDCSSLKACVASRCVDPCMTLACGRGALCDVVLHAATCKCAAGFIRDPSERCTEEILVGRLGSG